MTINKVISASIKDFSDAVKWVSKTSDGLVKLDIKKDDTLLYLSTFSDTKSSRSKIDIQFVSGKQGDHTFIVSSAIISNALKLLKGTEFTITVSSTTMVIKAGRAVVNVPVVKGKDAITLPDLPTLVGRVSISDLRKAVSNVSLAASAEDGTAILMAIHLAFSPKNKTLSFVATDRYKMMMRTIDFDPINDEMDDFSMNIYASSMKTLIAGLPSTDSTIDIHTEPDGSQLVIRDVNYLTGVGAVDGEFVQYSKFLQIPFASKIKVELAELKSAIDGISAIATGEEGISLTFTSNSVVVSTVSNVGTIECFAEGNIVADAPVDEEEVFGTDEVEEASIMVAFSPKIIRPVISSLSTKFIEFHYNKPTTPWVAKEIDDSTDKTLDTSFTLLMPIRL